MGRGCLLSVPVHSDLQGCAQYAQLAEVPRHFEEVIFGGNKSVNDCAWDEDFLW